MPPAAAVTHTAMPPAAAVTHTAMPHIPGGAPQAAEGTLAKLMQNKKLLAGGAVGLGALGLGGALYARHRHNQQTAVQNQQG